MANIYWKDDPNYYFAHFDSRKNLNIENDQKKIIPEEDIKRATYIGWEGRDTAQKLMQDLRKKDLVGENLVSEAKRTGDPAKDRYPDQITVKVGYRLATPKTEVTPDDLTVSTKTKTYVVCTYDKTDSNGKELHGFKFAKRNETIGTGFGNLLPVSNKEQEEQKPEYFECSIAGRVRFNCSAEITHFDPDYIYAISFPFKDKGDGFIFDRESGNIVVEGRSMNKELKTTTYYKSFDEIMESDLPELYKNAVKEANEFAKELAKEKEQNYSPSNSEKSKLINLSIALNEAYKAQGMNISVPVYEIKDGKYVRDNDNKLVIKDYEKKPLNFATVNERKNDKGESSYELVAKNRRSGISVRIRATANSYPITDVFTFKDKEYVAIAKTIKTGAELNSIAAEKEIESLIDPIVDKLNLNSPLCEQAAKINELLKEGETVVTQFTVKPRGYAVFCNNENHIIVKDRQVKDEYLIVTENDTEVMKGFGDKIERLPLSSDNLKHFSPEIVRSVRSVSLSSLGADNYNAANVDNDPVVNETIEETFSNDISTSDPVNTEDLEEYDFFSEGVPF